MRAIYEIWELGDSMLEYLTHHWGLPGAVLLEWRPEEQRELAEGGDATCTNTLKWE